MKPELGTKRVCPTTGRKFYDLNKDPIVSPYSGETFARSVFEPQVKGRAAPEKARVEEAEVEVEETEDVEIISLEDADDEGAKSSPKRNDADIDADDDLDEDISTDDDDDTFLADDEDDGDDVSDLIEGDLKDDEEP